MNRRSTSHLVTWFIACVFCVSGSVFADDESFHNVTLESLGYDTSTYSSGGSVYINFSSPYEESSGQMDLHIIVLDDGTIEVEINEATMFSEYFDRGEILAMTTIPTGLIDLGNNTIAFYFKKDGDGSCKVTLLEDSAINITSAI